MRWVQKIYIRIRKRNGTTAQTSPKHVALNHKTRSRESHFLSLFVSFFSLYCMVHTWERKRGKWESRQFPDTLSTRNFRCPLFVCLSVRLSFYFSSFFTPLFIFSVFSLSAFFSLFLFYFHFSVSIFPSVLLTLFSTSLGSGKIFLIVIKKRKKLFCVQKTNGILSLQWEF